MVVSWYGHEAVPDGTEHLPSRAATTNHADLLTNGFNHEKTAWMLRSLLEN